MNANGFPGVPTVESLHTPHAERPVVDVERAGFNTLNADQRAAMARFQAAGERSRRIRENSDDLVIVLSSLAILVRAAIENNLAPRNMPVTFHSELKRAEELLARIEGAA